MTGVGSLLDWDFKTTDSYARAGRDEGDSSLEQMGLVNRGGHCKQRTARRKREGLQMLTNEDRL